MNAPNLLLPVRTIAPAQRPIDINAAKEHCRIDTDDEDALIDALIDAAVGLIDGTTLGRAIILQTWRQDFPAFPAFPTCHWGNGCYPGDYGLRLPLAPAVSITSVTYRDGSNAQQTFSGSSYALLSDAISPFVQLAPGYTAGWPGTYCRADAVSVTAVYGYGDIGDVPGPIVAAMKMLISHWYENREAVAPQNFNELPFAVSALLQPFRRYLFG